MSLIYTMRLFCIYTVGHVKELAKLNGIIKKFGMKIYTMHLFCIYTVGHVKELAKLNGIIKKFGMKISS